MLEDVTKALRATASKEEFCASVRAPADGFRIEVKGVGPLAFPISQKKAKALMEISRLAPFGWRDQTVVDTRVRNVWEVPKNRIKIPRSPFSKTIGPVLDRIKKKLGLDPKGTLTAELHSLLVYEQGQFFSSHQDSEKSDGMVATMVILLPSGFQGGSLVIDHQGEKKTFRAPSKAGKELSIFAFYADCHHEVKKVTSGHRIALTYNLNFESTSSLPSGPCSPGLVKRIRKYFQAKQEEESWHDHDHPNWLVYLLDHQYSPKGLNWGRLKGVDRARAAQLCAAAAELDLIPYLALADVHEIWQTVDDYDGGRRRSGFRYHGDDDDEDEDEEEDGEDYTLDHLIEDDCFLAHWMDGNGKKLRFTKYSPPGRMLCWTKAHDDLKPFESNYEGYMGNYGNTLDRWYHRAAIVLWPREQEFQSRFALDPIAALKKIKRALAKDARVGAELLGKVLPQWSRLRYSLGAGQIKDVLELARLVENKDLARRMLTGFTLEIICKANGAGLARLAEAYGSAWMVELFEHWSEERRFGRKCLSELCDVTKHLAHHPGALRWLLAYQVKVLSEEDTLNQSKGRKIDLVRAAPAGVKQTLELLKSASDAKEHGIFRDMVGHVLRCPRVYSGESLAQLALKLHRHRGIDSGWKGIAAEAVRRLESKLSGKREPGDLSISEKVPCNCADCEALADFLRDKGEEQLVWPLAMRRRQHIHSTIEGMGIGVTHKTQRTGSPHQLVLTKTKAHFKKEELEFERQLGSWKWPGRFLAAILEEESYMRAKQNGHILETGPWNEPSEAHNHEGVAMELLNRILADKQGQEEELLALFKALQENVELPADAHVIGEPVSISEFVYDGNSRRGITVLCLRENGNEYVLGLAEVQFPPNHPASEYARSYRAWLGLGGQEPGLGDANTHKPHKVANGELDMNGPVELAVLELKDSAIRCLVPGSGRVITLRAGGHGLVVPGEIISVCPRKQWHFNGHPYLSGSIDAVRVDVEALGLQPLRLMDEYPWDPKEDWWREAEEPLEDWEKPILARGVRPSFEMERVMPSEDPKGFDDPVSEAADLERAGDRSGAREILYNLLATDLRCIDAHAHLGSLEFNLSPDLALRHYEVGVRIAEQALPDGFDGVLPWGRLDNRPYLRCLHGFGLCLWRLERFDEATTIFDRMLWLNPTDNQGMRMLLPQVRAEESWETCRD